MTKPVLKDTLEVILERFPEISVLVIGDLMLDRYWWGEVERMSPEAPVPVVDHKGSSLVPGGAANVASNVTALGGKAVLLGVVGDDEEGHSLLEVLRGSVTDIGGVVVSSSRPTTVKTRVIAQNQQVVRIDRESSEDLGPDDSKALLLAAEAAAPNASIAVLSDYAKGLLSVDNCARLITILENADVKILVDPKGKDFKKYKGAEVITPNEREAISAADMDPKETPMAAAAGMILLKKFDLQKLVITCGEKGMLLFRNDSAEVTEIKAESRNVFDVTGAGDTVIATMALALAAGSEFEAAVELANIAAGEVIRIVGTSAIRIEVLREALDGRPKADSEI